MTEREEILSEAAVSKMIQLQKLKDTERAHVEADQCMCDLLKYLGFHDVAKEYEAINKQYT